MASLLLFLYLTILLIGTVELASPVHQKNGLVSGKTNGNLTLKCFYEGDVAARLYWYKQSLGQTPKLVSTFYIYETNSTFYDEFKNNPRFKLDTKNGKNHLMITDLHISDSATYYCMSSYLYTLRFSESITVIVKDANLKSHALVQQSTSETVQSGGSVTLKCTVHAGTCDGEHSVYWFRDSGESYPGIIYTQGGMNDQCERKPDTQTHTCVYSLPMNRINVSHAGIYYCAVASCGHVLFGEGTKLDFEDDHRGTFFWTVGFAITSTLSVLLTFLVCMKNKKKSCKSPDFQASPLKADLMGLRDAEKLYFAALSVNLINRSRSQRDDTWSECVYYSVK